MYLITCRARGEISREALEIPETQERELPALCLPRRVSAATIDGAARLAGYFAAARDCLARRANGTSPRSLA